MQTVTLPCPNASNYDPSNPYKHFVAAIEEIGKLPILDSERRRLVELLGKVRTEAFCQGNDPKEPF